MEFVSLHASPSELFAEAVAAPSVLGRAARLRHCQLATSCRVLQSASRWLEPDVMMGEGRRDEDESMHLDCLYFEAIGYSAGT